MLQAPSLGVSDCGGTQGVVPLGFLGLWILEVSVEQEFGGIIWGLQIWGRGPLDWKLLLVLAGILVHKFLERRCRAILTVV